MNVNGHELSKEQADLLQSRLAAIIAGSDDAIVSKDLNGIVQSWNLAAERIFGYTADEMIGQPITRLIPPDRQEEEPAILARLRRGERVDHFQTVRRHKLGHEIHVSVTISPIHDASGTVVGASKIARDITHQKSAELERERLLASEREARADAEHSSRLKDEFLATLSHELRTPLNAIYGWAQLLQRPQVSDEEISEGLEVIARNARVQTQLVDDLLDMSRIISGKLRLDVRPIDLEEVIDAAMQSVLPAARAKDIHIHKRIDPATSATGAVTGDAARLQQVIWNLLSNAVKFTPAYGRVEVLLEPAGSSVQIIVTDTGQGISAEFLPYLFERFRQADGSTTRRHGGLGLGLAIAKHLVELHGGTISASSPGPGLGTRLVVSLPARARPMPEARSFTRPSAMDDVRLDGLKVLVVDDEPDALDLIRRILTDAGATVSVTASADDAIARLLSERPAVLVSDIGMPGEDGYRLLQRVRQLPDEGLRRIPAVALTAFARPEDRRRALLAGFQMFVPKPLEPAELIAVVASVTQRV